MMQEIRQELMTFKGIMVTFLHVLILVGGLESWIVVKTQVVDPIWGKAPATSEPRAAIGKGEGLWPND